MSYKRLTKKADVILLDCGYSCGGLHLDVVKRLGELEDKIENGTLKELSEDSVVLTETERIAMCAEQWDKGFAQGSKEIAEKYHREMQKVIHERDYIGGYAEIGLLEENNEIAKQLGAKIEE